MSLTNFPAEFLQTVTVFLCAGLLTGAVLGYFKNLGGR